jgi:hypothetical protein
VTNTGSSTNEIVIGTTAAGNGSNTITLGNASTTTLYAPPTIRQVTGASLTLGDATTTGGIIVPAAVTAGLICNSLSSNAATKLVLNSTEANGVIEIQKSGTKTGVIQYANATFPVQLLSQSALSLDAGAGFNTHISAGGPWWVIWSI